MTDRMLVSGAPVPDDDSHTQLKDNGQQKDYVVLTPEERAKGFVRPVRHSYVHVGVRPKNPLRDLTPDEHKHYDKYNYVKYEEYPKSASPICGRFWTEKELNSGCGVTTKMSLDIAETYARDPKFYGGTFCIGCGVHLPVSQFVWEGTDETVGS